MHFSIHRKPVKTTELPPPRPYRFGWSHALETHFRVHLHGTILTDLCASHVEAYMQHPGCYDEAVKNLLTLLEHIVLNAPLWNYDSVKLVEGTSTSHKEANAAAHRACRHVFNVSNKIRCTLTEEANESPNSRMRYLLLSKQLTDATHAACEALLGVADKETLSWHGRCAESANRLLSACTIDARMHAGRIKAKKELLAATGTNVELAVHAVILRSVDRIFGDISNVFNPASAVQEQLLHRRSDAIAEMETVLTTGDGDLSLMLFARTSAVIEELAPFSHKAKTNDPVGDTMLSVHITAEYVKARRIEMRLRNDRDGEYTMHFHWSPGQTVWGGAHHGRWFAVDLKLNIGTFVRNNRTGDEFVI